MGYKSHQRSRKCSRGEKKVKSYVRSNGVRVKAHCSKKVSQRSPRKSSSRKGSHKVSRKGSRKGSVRTKAGCTQLLKNKISKNMKEYKEGRYASRQQALAVSYSQVKKSSPHCKRYFKRQ